MLTIKDMAYFLIDKKEHYPLSDEFIKQYQQPGGGYIDFAIKTGHPVDKDSCEPNQKWHFFESWLIEGFREGKRKSWDEDACKAFYSHCGIKCPELLLWFLEAVGTDPAMVEDVKKKAEALKRENISVVTIAKEIRKMIPWEDIEKAIQV